MEITKNSRENLIKGYPALTISREHKQKKVNKVPEMNWIIFSQLLFHFGISKAIFQM